MSIFLRDKLRGCKILIVNDSYNYSKILQNDSIDINVMQVKSYQNAIKELKNKYDIIITELNLNDNKSGFDLALEVKLKDLNTQVIIITTNTNPENMMKAVQFDIYDYLISPVTEDALFRSIGRAIEKKELLDEKEKLEKSFKKLQEKVSDIISLKKNVTALDSELLNVAMEFEESRKTSSNKLSKITQELKHARNKVNIKKLEDDENAR